MLYETGMSAEYVERKEFVRLVQLIKSYGQKCKASFQHHRVPSTLQFTVTVLIA